MKCIAKKTASVIDLLLGNRYNEIGSCRRCGSEF